MNGFEELISKQIKPDKAERLLDYFEDVWIGRPDRQKSGRPSLVEEVNLI